jgi:hydroxylamine reductase
MTTNCIQRPMESYKDNIFTSGPVGWPGTPHVTGADFSPVINRALELPGFPADKEGKFVTVGFGRNAVLTVADKVIDLVKSGRISSVFCWSADATERSLEEAIIRSSWRKLLKTLSS